ncbi:MAG: hypothetical protein QXE70_09695 [Ignisphaera sp.]
MSGKHRISLDELTRFIFGYLWKRYGMILNDSIEELKMELEYMEKFGYIDLGDGVLKLKEKLKDFYNIVECSSLARENKLFREYIEKISKAMLKYLVIEDLVEV